MDLIEWIKLFELLAMHTPNEHLHGYCCMGNKMHCLRFRTPHISNSFKITEMIDLFAIMVVISFL